MNTALTKAGGIEIGVALNAKHVAAALPIVGFLAYQRPDARARTERPRPESESMGATS